MSSSWDHDRLQPALLFRPMIVLIWSSWLNFNMGGFFFSGTEGCNHPTLSHHEANSNRGSGFEGWGGFKKCLSGTTHERTPICRFRLPFAGVKTPFELVKWENVVPLTASPLYTYNASLQNWITSKGFLHETYRKDFCGFIESRILYDKKKIGVVIGNLVRLVSFAANITSHFSIIRASNTK